MTYAYISVGTDFNDILAISSRETTVTTIEVVLDDEALYFSKLEGYKAYSDDEGVNHLKFDKDKYSEYLATKKAKEDAEKKNKKKEEIRNDILDLVSISYEDSDKEGYQYKVYKLGDVTIKKEYVKVETEGNDGSDYTKPITYKEGMTVIESAWYTDGNDIWECIKTGTPSSFSDTEYFDIVSA